MKFKMLVAIAISSLMTASFANIAPSVQTAADDQSMQAPAGADNSNNNLSGAAPQSNSDAAPADSQPSDAGSASEDTTTDNSTGDQAAGNDDDY